MARYRTWRMSRTHSRASPIGAGRCDRPSVVRTENRHSGVLIQMRDGFNGVNMCVITMSDGYNCIAMDAYSNMELPKYIL